MVCKSFKRVCWGRLSCFGLELAFQAGTGWLRILRRCLFGSQFGIVSLDARKCRWKPCWFVFWSTFKLGNLNFSFCQPHRPGALRLCWDHFPSGLPRSDSEPTHLCASQTQPMLWLWSPLAVCCVDDFQTPIQGLYSALKTLCAWVTNLLFRTSWCCTVRSTTRIWQEILCQCWMKWNNECDPFVAIRRWGLILRQLRCRIPAKVRFQVQLWNLERCRTLLTG